jgi:glycosyltransferase involved in cell wall biosynthesis
MKQKSKKKILFFIPRYLKLSDPTSVKFRHILPDLSGENEIHVLCFYRGTVQNKVSEDNLTIHQIPYSKMGRKIFVKSGVKIIQNGKKQEYKSSSLRRLSGKLKGWALFFPDPLIVEYFSIKRALQSLISEHDFDIVVGSANPHTTQMFASYAKKIKPGIIWIQDIGDPFKSPYDRYLTVKILSFLGFLYEKKCAKYIDYLIVTNEATKKYYVRRYKPYREDNVAIHRHGAVILDQNKERPMIKRNDKLPLKLIYAGTFYDGFREPYHLYSALKKLKDDFELDLFGSIPYRHLPQDNQGNIFYKGSLSYKDLQERFGSSDIIVYIDNAYGLQTPGKSYEVLCKYKPVLCIYENDNSPILELYRKIPFVFMCKNNENEIITALKDLKEKISHGQVDFEYDISLFSWEKRVSEYDNILDTFYGKNGDRQTE